MQSASQPPCFLADHILGFPWPIKSSCPSFLQRACGSCCLIGDVGKTEGLQDMHIHSKKVPAYVSTLPGPRQVFTSKGLGPYGEEGYYAEGSSRLCDTRSKTSGSARRVGASSQLPNNSQALITQVRRNSCRQLPNPVLTMLQAYGHSVTRCIQAMAAPAVEADVQ